MINRLSLLTRFSILSLVITAGVFLFVAWGLERRQEDNFLHMEATSAADQVKGILTTNMDFPDFIKPLDKGRYAQVDELIQKSIVDEHVVGVKLWDTQGRLIYTNGGDRNIVGQTTLDPGRLAQALSGKLSTETSSGAIAGLRVNSSAAVLEIYAPVRLDGSDRVVGVMGVYHDLNVLQPAISGMRLFVLISMGLGAGFLYLSLLASCGALPASWSGAIGRTRSWMRKSRRGGPSFPRSMSCRATWPNHHPNKTAFSTS